MMENKVTLYIITHNKTGLKYFGKTIRWFTVEDLQKYYRGSGTRWNNHLNKHGKDITFEIFGIFSLNENDDDYVKPIALNFSKEHDITNPESNWANIVEEDGVSGRSEKGRIWTEEHRKNHKESMKNITHKSMLGKKQSDFQKERASETHKNKIVSEETKIKISISKKGKKMSEEAKKNISNAKKGIPKPKIECPHCGKIGGTPQMKRYHFDNCKEIN
jgi:hypothetical protein